MGFGTKDPVPLIEKPQDPLMNTSSTLCSGVNIKYVYPKETVFNEKTIDHLQEYSLHTQIISELKFVNTFASFYRLTVEKTDQLIMKHELQKQSSYIHDLFLLWPMKKIEQCTLNPILVEMHTMLFKTYLTTNFKKDDMNKWTPELCHGKVMEANNYWKTSRKGIFPNTWCTMVSKTNVSI